MTVSYTTGYPETATSYADLNGAIAMFLGRWELFRTGINIGVTEAHTVYDARTAIYTPPITAAGATDSKGSLQTLQSLFGATDGTGFIHSKRIELIGLLSSMHLHIDQNTPTYATAGAACSAIAGLTYATGFNVAATNTADGIKTQLLAVDDLVTALKQAHSLHRTAQLAYLDQTTWQVTGSMTIASMNEINKALLFDTAADTGGLHLARVAVCDALADMTLTFRY